jgi:hypothetical protein
VIANLLTFVFAAYIIYMASVRPDGLLNMDFLDAEPVPRQRHDVSPKVNPTVKSSTSSSSNHLNLVDHIGHPHARPTLTPDTTAPQRSESWLQ